MTQARTYDGVEADIDPREALRSRLRERKDKQNMRLLHAASKTPLREREVDRRLPRRPCQPPLNFNFDSNVECHQDSPYIYYGS